LSGFPLRPTWAEVDLAAIAHNVREFRRITPDRTRIMAVVKADGYGHGSVEVARQALAAGASFLGVALVEEGVNLRENGITAPILVLGFTPRSYATLLCAYDLTPTVFTMPEAEAFSNAAVQCGRKLPVHVKVDTGMGRVGFFPCRDADEFIIKVVACPGLELEGLYTHFAAADSEDLDHARGQLQRFLKLVRRLAERGLNIPLKHAANSAAAMYLPEAHLDMVRIGISLYGLPPSASRTAAVNLQPAMALKTKIIYLKQVPSGTSVSYGCTFTTVRDSLLASLPVGYADGYSRRLSNRGHVLVHGQRAPIAGRVCMDQMVVDVSGIPGVCLDDEVVLFGRQNDNAITVDEVAQCLETINYEVVTTVSRRVPRLYLNGGS
jgi:alanine racemase